MAYLKPIHFYNRNDEFSIGENFSLLGEAHNLGIETAPALILPPEVFTSFLVSKYLDQKISFLLTKTNFHRPETFQDASRLIGQLISNNKFPTGLEKEFLKETESNQASLYKLSVEAVYRGRRLHESYYLFDRAGLTPVLARAWNQVFTPKLIKTLTEDGADLSQLKITTSLTPVKAAQASVIAQKNNPDLILWFRSGLNPNLVSQSNLFSLRNFNQAVVGPNELGFKTIDLNHRGSWLINKKTNSSLNGAISSEELNNDYLVESTIDNETDLLNLLLRHTKQIQFHQNQINNALIGSYQTHWTIVDDRAWLDQIGQVAPKPVPATNELILAHGKMLFPGLVTGQVLIASGKNLDQADSEKIVVLSEVPTDFQNLSKARGLIFEELIRDPLSLQRHLSNPAIHGVTNAKLLIKPGAIITLNALTGKVTKASLSQKPLTIFSEKVGPNQQGGIKETKASTSTATKVLLSIQEEEPASLLKQADGLLFYPEKIIAASAIHPNRIQTEEGNQISQNLIEEIEKTAAHLSQKTVFFSLADFSSNLLKHFKYGEIEEKDELNPSFGLTGAVRLNNQSSYLNEQIDAISQIRPLFIHGQLNIIFPFARHPDELVQIKKKLATKRLYDFGNLGFFGEIATSENLLNLARYLQIGLSGWIINTDKIISSLYSLDLTNHKLVEQVKFDNDLVLELIAQAIGEAKGVGNEVYLKTSHLVEQTKLVKLSVNSGVSGLITSDSHALHDLKTQLSQAEFNLLLK